MYKNAGQLLNKYKLSNYVVSYTNAAMPASYHRGGQAGSGSLAVCTWSSECSLGRRYGWQQQWQRLTLQRYLLLVCCCYNTDDHAEAFVVKRYNTKKSGNILQPWPATSARCTTFWISSPCKHLQRNSTLYRIPRIHSICCSTYSWLCMCSVHMYYPDRLTTQLLPEPNIETCVYSRDVQTPTNKHIK